MTTLENIAIAEATPAEAHALIVKLLTEDAERHAAAVYDALGAWVWRAIDARRRDRELREWFHVIRRASALLADRDVARSERLKTLYDMVETSVRASGGQSPNALRLSHVHNILAVLFERPGSPTEKRELSRRLGLKAANLTRVLNRMAEARLVERVSNGRHAGFYLTTEGIRVAQKSAKPSIQIHGPAEQLEDGIRKLLATFQLTLRKGKVAKPKSRQAQQPRLVVGHPVPSKSKVSRRVPTRRLVRTRKVRETAHLPPPRSESHVSHPAARALENV